MVRSHVGDAHYQHEIHARGDPVALLDRRLVGDPGLEFAQPFSALLVQRQLDDRRQAGQAIRRHDGDLPLYPSASDQTPDPTQTGRRRDVNPVGKRLIRQRAVALKDVQQALVDCVEARIPHGIH